jgi:hypothetical protein
MGEQESKTRGLVGRLRGRVRRTLGTLKDRLSGPWAVAVGIATLVGTVLAVLGALNSSSDLSPEESRLLNLMPQKLAAHCRPYDPEFDPNLSPLVAADLKCEPLDAGPDAVKFHLFTNRQDLDTFMDTILEELGQAGISCNQDFPYAAPWVDAEGRVIGELQCADFEDFSRLMWTYDDVPIVASASSLPQGQQRLHEWWQRHVRFGGRNPSGSARRHLTALLPAGFGDCEPGRILLPMALASVQCTPGDGISSAGAELFTSRKLLSDYLDRRAELTGIDTDGCGNSPFSYKPYGWSPDYRPRLGYLLCRPDSGAEWFEWTAFGPLVYAYAARDDSNLDRLYEQWAESLAWIRNVRDVSGAS